MADLPTTGVGNSAPPNGFGSAPNGALTLIGAGGQDAAWASYGADNPTGEIEVYQGYALNDMPGDFGSMATLAVQLRYGWGGAFSNVTWPELKARIVSGGAVLAAANSAGDTSVVATSITNTSPVNSATISFAYVNTGASKAQWDAAVLEIGLFRIRNKGGSSTQQRVYAASITGTYTASTFSITTTTLADARQFVAYSDVVETEGGAPPYTFSIISGALPPGLTLNNDGTITGTPTATGEYTFTVQAGSASGSDTQALSIDVTVPAEVFLADGDDFDTATLVEQTITAYSPESIEFTVSQGELSTGTAYVFVRNADGKVSKEYPVTLGEPSAGGNKIWSEDFDYPNGPLPLSTNTTPRTWMPVALWQLQSWPDRGYNDWAGYSYNRNPNGTDSNPFHIENGILRLEVIRETTNAGNGVPGGHDANTTREWQGGILITDPREPHPSDTGPGGRVFTEGYMEWRARWPIPGQGMFPALWSFATGNVSDVKRGAEIDMVEIFGHATGSPWNLSAHHDSEREGPGPLYDTLSPQTHDDTTVWHRYGLERIADELRFYRDGVHLFTWGDDDWWNGVPMDIRINFSMFAGPVNWGAGGQATAQTPDLMYVEVDYVRAYDALPEIALIETSDDPEQEAPPAEAIGPPLSLHIG